MGLPPGGADSAAELGAHVRQLSSFGQDAAGELYARSLAGGVFKLVALSCRPSRSSKRARS
jgi:hypothetical protein